MLNSISRISIYIYTYNCNSRGPKKWGPVVLGRGDRRGTGDQKIMENITFLKFWQLSGVLFWLAFLVAASKAVSALFWTPRGMVLELRAGSRVPAKLRQNCAHQYLSFGVEG